MIILCSFMWTSQTDRRTHQKYSSEPHKFYECQKLFGSEILKKNEKKFFWEISKYFNPKKLLQTQKIFFFFDFFTPKCIELNSEFVRPEKKLGFGFGSRPKTHRDPSQNVWLCVWWKWVGERMYECVCVFVCVVVCRY